MAIDALVKPFLRLALFQGLKPLELTEIVRRADRIVYKPGDVIIQEDKAGDAAIIIVSGEAVRLSDSDNGTPAEPLPEGSIVGEMAMLVETVYSTTVIAKGQVRALRITRENLHEQMLEEPRLAGHFADKITARLQRLASELRSIDEALAGIAQFEPKVRIIAHHEAASALH
jgi:CRP-like cAMP-binding protein